MFIETRNNARISSSLPLRGRGPGVNGSRSLVRDGPIALLQVVLVLVLIFPAIAFAQEDRAVVESVSATLSLESQLSLRQALQRTATMGVPSDASGYQSRGFPSAIEEIFYDGFEGAFPGPWMVSDDNGSTGGEVFWGATSYRADVGSWSAGCAASGANASPPGADYKNDMFTWMVYGPFSLSDAVGGSLSFRLWLDSEIDYDWLYWTASTDGVNFSGSGSSGNTGGWVSKSLDFTAVPSLGDITGGSSVWIAFIFISDFSITSGEGAYVDEVRIEKNTGGGTPVLRVEPTQLIFERDGGGSTAALSEYSTSREEEALMAMPQPQRFTRLEQLARQSGSVPVIVGLSRIFTPEGLLGISEVAQQRSAFATAQQSLLTRLTPDLDYLPGTVKQFETIPYLALRVTEVGLQMLQEATEVSSIHEDKLLAPTLAESVPLVGASALHASGLDGAGAVVAVLDTGVDKSHPFLAGKVVSEACYSAGSGPTAFSLCPGGSSSSTAVGSGVNCDASVFGCDHGTHVAGIAVGDGLNPGVAPGAELIAIQIFHGLEDTPTSTPCADWGFPSPCSISSVSDEISGLERVYALRNSFNIASVNLSIGGGYFPSPCDDEPDSSIIANLRSVEIAVVAASGNAGFTDALEAPACISDAISVGSSTDVDAVSTFSNSSDFLDLLAPGQSIRSSVPGGGFETWPGTSMATPHVSGAFALLRSAVPTATVEDVLVALKETGVPILDSRNGITKPRIQVDSALDWLENPNLQLESFFIHNDGDAPLTVSSLELNTPADWIDWNPKSPFEVGPGGSQEVAVTVDFGLAPDGQSTRQLNVDSNGGGGAVEIVVNNTEVLAAPTNLVATAVSSTQINLSWTDNANNETGFKIERSPNGTNSWTQIGTVGADVTTYQSTGLTPLTTYYYRVYAYAGAVDSSYSNTAHATTDPGPSLSAPSDLTATAISSSRIDLSWNDNSSGELGFKIERSPNGASSWTQVATVGANATTYQNTGLMPSTTYYYRVRAYDGAVDSDYSNTAHATTLPNPPAAPSSLAASAVSSSQINLTWTDNSGNETGFKIERGASGGGPFSEIAAVGPNQTTYQNTGLNASTTYYYRVRAYSAGGHSAFSNIGSATTEPPDYDVPGDFTIGGYLGVGTDSPERAVHLKGSNSVFRMDRSTNSAAFLLVRTDDAGQPLKTFVVGVNASSSNQGEFIINDLGSAVGGGGERRMTIDNSGEVEFTAAVRAAEFIPTSSLRFKTNIRALENPLKTVSQLRGVQFNWKATGQPALGLIAEEVEEVLPEVVSREANGQTRGVNYDSLVALLVEASKAQERELEALKTQQKDLQALLQELKRLNQNATQGGGSK